MNSHHSPSTGDTRERIIAAAIALLSEGGREAVSTRSVSAAAGVQAPTIYRLFGDKQGLLDAVAAHGFAAYLSSKVAHKPGADPVEDLRTGWGSSYWVRTGQPVPVRADLRRAPSGRRAARGHRRSRYPRRSHSSHRGGGPAARQRGTRRAPHSCRWLRHHAHTHFNAGGSPRSGPVRPGPGSGDRRDHDERSRRSRSRPAQRRGRLARGPAADRRAD